MKKFIFLLTLMFCICSLASAQLKLIIYDKNGDTTEFVASSVDSISFAPSITNQKDPYIENASYGYVLDAGVQNAKVVSKDDVSDEPEITVVPYLPI